MIKFFSWFIILYFKINKINKIELVIRNDGYTFRKRDFEREEMIKHALEKIK